MFQRSYHVSIVLRPRLQLSENVTRFAVCCIYTGVISRETQIETRRFEAYHLYTECTTWGMGQNLAAPLLESESYITADGHSASLSWN
jgi:hypothetical protein